MFRQEKYRVTPQKSGISVFTHAKGSPAVNSASIFPSKQVLESREVQRSKTGLHLKIEAELIAGFSLQ